MLVWAMFSHYRRHPFQLLALALMVVVATMLWTGVALLTDQARASLAQSEQAVASRHQVVRNDGQPVSVDDFVILRVNGVCVAPWLEVHRAAPGGRVIGIDPLAFGCFADAGPAQGTSSLEGEPFLDIRQAVDLTRQGHDSDFYLLAPHTRTLLPPGYAFADFSLGPPTGELADSFLLNLDALSVLVLLITGLLVRSVHQLGLAQRQDSLALLERFGVPFRKLRWVLALELMVLSALCVVPGVVLGSWLAGVLGSGFGQALDSLFDISLYAGSVPSLPWRSALVMVVLVLLACLVDWLIPRQWLARQRQGPLLTRLLPLLVLSAGLMLVFLAKGLLVVFLGIALVFASVGWLSPVVLGSLANGCAIRSRNPLSLWRYRELAVMFRHLALPVVALQFAVATVLAVQALVTTFEDTFEDWLDQRLEAAFYVEVPSGVNVNKGLRQLESLEGIGEWHRVARDRASIRNSGRGGEPQIVDLFALAPIGPLVTDWGLITNQSNPWQKLAEGGLMINEQLARRQELAPGDDLTVAIGNTRYRAEVVAVYADYGRPAGEVMMFAGFLPAAFEPRFVSLSINPGSLSMPRITRELEKAWGTSGLEVRDNASIRALASQVFSQTFLLTRAISVLTLALAAVSLLVMGWVFFMTRAWYFRLLVIWGLPVEAIRGQLLRLSVLLTTAVACIALPVGIWLNWALVSRINPLAFGWSLPMSVYPWFWLELTVLCAVIGLVIAILMRRQLEVRQ